VISRLKIFVAVCRCFRGANVIVRDVAATMFG